MREQGEVLEHQPDPAALGRQAMPRLGQHPAIEGDAAGLKLLEAGHQLERGGLAAAGWPDQAMHLAGCDRQRHAIDDLPAAETVRQRRDIQPRGSGAALGGAAGRTSSHRAVR